MPDRIPGDANGDGRVDVSDLGILTAHYGATAGATWGTGDFNGDGKVDVGDLGILAANYGTGTGGTLDFDRDAEAYGLAMETPDDSSASAAFDCGSSGFGIITAIVLLGFWPAKWNN